MKYLFFIGLGMIVLGLAASLLHRLRLNRYEVFPAEVIGIREKTVPDGKGSVYRIFCPVVKFRMYGIERTSEHFKYEKMTTMRSHVGDKVNVRIHRKRAQTFYFEGEAAEASTTGFILLLSGTIVAAASLFIMFII